MVEAKSGLSANDPMADIGKCGYELRHEGAHDPCADIGIYAEWLFLPIRSQGDQC